MEKITSAHRVPQEEIIQALGVDQAYGLASSEIKKRTEHFGKNELAAPPSKPWWKEILEELTEPMILLLLAVGVVYGFLGELRDAITIVVIIIAVLAIEIGNESRAKGAIKALSKFNVISTPVLRNGKYEEIPSAELVIGDIVYLRSGKRIPADLRLLESIGLKIDESSLTGESVPVEKNANLVLQPETALGERHNLAFSGTLVVSGKGKGIVVSTGSNTELGKFVGLVKTAREPRTPLQLYMRELSKWMVWIALGFSAIIAVIGWIWGTGWRETLLTALTLAFATIPEELPILITMVLGLGAYRLSKKRAIIRRLKTAETLGNITVVATDKTGTLTENKMQVQKWFVNGEWLSDKEWKQSPCTDLAVQISVLANDAIVSGKDKDLSFEGDPTDVAFYHFANGIGRSVLKIKNDFSIINEIPLTENSKRITVAVQRDDKQLLMSKGAPEQLLTLSDYVIVNGDIVPINEEVLSDFAQQAENLASEGYRVLGLAYREGSTLDENGLVFVGLTALMDPPRQTVKEAIDSLHNAGVRVIMITGDHSQTAKSIGRQVGINSHEVVLGNNIEQISDSELPQKLKDTNIFARTTPEHKLRIVRALQQDGEIVAVTGDGVNDGPALKEAAVGIAMGKSGTDVAKEAADMILADDDFSTVMLAIKEGRKLFANLHKAVRYYLSAKVALITSTLIPVLVGVSLPFSPIQIIIMELFMDLGASTSFTAEPPESDIMKRPPRKGVQRFLDKSMVFGIFSGGFTLGLAVLIAYMWSLNTGSDPNHSQSVAFVTWMIGHLVLALIMRSEREPLFSLGLFSNKVMLLWIASAAVFLALTQVVPFLSKLLHLEPISFTDWIIVLLCSLIIPLWIEIRKMLYWKK